MDKNKEQNNTKRGKVLTGTVISNKMEKTVVVRVDQYKKHPMYQKYVSSKKNYKVHDEEGNLNVGDKVEIVETNPISKDKRFKISNVIEKAVIVDIDDNK